MPILGLTPSDKPTYPAHFDIENVVRPNILALHPYRCARDDYTEGILLDANENSIGHTITSASSSSSSSSVVNGNKSAPRSANGDLIALVDPTGEASKHLSLDLNRYPDPAQREIKRRIAQLRNVVSTDGSRRPLDETVFLGVGSDEVIDLLMRICVAPGKEKIMTTPPTYGMYSVCAQVNDVGVVKIPLVVGGEGKQGWFQLDLPAMKSAIDTDPTIKLIFLASPGNPTGTLIRLSDIQELLEYEKFKGIVVVDEAYIDFAPPEASAVTLVQKYANLCVSQTLSKSFGLAAIRLGVAIAQPPLIQVLTNTKAPYNISTPTASLALSALSPPSLALLHSNISTLISSRKSLQSSLAQLCSLGLGIGGAIGGSEANFLMIPILDKETGKPDNGRSERVYIELAEKEGVVTRFRGKEYGCEGCLRITVGTEEENKLLLEKMKVVLEKI